MEQVRALLAPAWQTRDIGLLISARMLMSAARALAGVITPIYLAKIGFSALQLGGLFTLVALTSAGLSTLVGTLSDRVGRKPFLIVLPGLAALAAVVFAVTRVGALLLIFAALGSFGRGAGAGAGAIGPYQPAEQAYLANEVSPRFRNAMFGRVAFASSLGALVGGGLFATLPDLLPRLGIPGMRGLAAYRPAFLVMAVFALAAGLLAVPLSERRSPTPPSPRRPASGGPRRSVRGVWTRLSRDSRHLLARLVVTSSVNGLAVGFFGPFITYWFYVRYGAGPALVGALYAVINIAAMLANLGAAPLAARLGLVRAIVVSRSLQALLMVPMVLAPTFWLAGAFYLLRMLAQRVGLPLRQSYTMGMVPAEERGTVGAISNLPAQVTSAISPTGAGYLFDHAALELPFLIGAALQGLSTLLFFLFFRRLLPPEERTKGQPTPSLGPAAEATTSRTNNLAQK